MTEKKDNKKNSPTPKDNSQNRPDGKEYVKRGYENNKKTNRKR